MIEQERQRVLDAVDPRHPLAFCQPFERRHRAAELVELQPQRLNLNVLDVAPAQLVERLVAAIEPVAG